MYSRKWIVLTLALALGSAALADSSRGGSGATLPAFLIGGTQVHENDHEHWAKTLRGVGMNTVAVTVYARQGAWDSAHLWFEEDEPSVVQEIRAARASGLSVVLVLRVAVDHAFEENRFIWHGMIMPSSAERIRSWFERYGTFVLQWAAIAEREGVDVLGIGSEMKALSATLPVGRWGAAKNYYGTYWYQKRVRDRTRQFAEQIERRHLWVRGYSNYTALDEYLDARFEHTMAWARQAHLRADGRTFARINERRRLINECWIGLIGKTRDVYRGRLTYAANFDNYRNVGFWPWLDLIGINSYFSLRANLREAADPGVQLSHFTGRWESILEEIQEFKREQRIERMPFLFTELGYTFRRHSTVEPWAHDGFSVVGWKGKAHELVVWGEEPIDHRERRLALEALRLAHERLDSDLSGILYWKLSTDAGHAAIEPFVLHIGPDSTDGLQRVLAAFASSASGTF